MKTFKFSKKGFSEAKQYSRYKELKGTIIETLEKHPELFPVALGLVVAVGVTICSPMSDIVAYKTMNEETAKITFKYLIY